MFEHVALRASDRAATERFYAAVLPAIGVEAIHRSERTTDFGDYELSVAQASDRCAPTRGLHVGLQAPSIQAIHAFWEAGIAAGALSDGEPGPRPQYAPGYYGAFLLDPDGNSIEACRHERMRDRGLIGHLWLRTSDFARARQFQLTLAQEARLELALDEPDRIRVRASTGGSLTFLAAEHSTTGVHIAVAGRWWETPTA